MASSEFTAPCGVWTTKETVSPTPRRSFRAAGSRRRRRGGRPPAGTTRHGRRMRRAQLGLARRVDADDAGEARRFRRWPCHGRRDTARPAHADGAALLLDPARQRHGVRQLVLAVGVEGAVLRLEVGGPHHDLHVAGLDRDQVGRELARDAVGEAAAENERGAAEDHGAAGERVAPLRAEQVPEGDGEERAGSWLDVPQGVGRAHAGRHERRAERPRGRRPRPSSPGTETTSGQARAGTGSRRRRSSAGPR